jgi:hypothetical protein
MKRWCKEFISYPDDYAIVMYVDNIKSFVPAHESNADYREYLEWLEQGNTPEEINNGL